MSCTRRRQEIPVFGRFKQYFRRINAWPESDERFSTKLVVKCVSSAAFLSGMLFFGLCGHIYASVRGGHTSDFINDMLFLTSAVTWGTALTLYLYRGNEILDVINELSNPKYGIPKNFEKLTHKIDYNTDFVYYTTTFIGTSFAIVTYFWDTDCHTRKILDEENARGYICGLICPWWFPIDLNFFPFKHLIFASNMVLGLYFVPTIIPVYTLLQSFVNLTENRIQHLIGFVEDLNLVQDNLKTTKRKMMFCMGYYSEIISLIDDVNNIVGLMFAPTQNGLISLLIAILEYKTVVENDFRGLTPLLLWLLWQTLGCLSGQKLENASDRLKEALYGLPWYEIDPSLRTNFKMFHYQVQKTLHLKIRPSIHMNMQYYYQVMKGSYTFLMYLKRF